MHRLASLMALWLLMGSPLTAQEPLRRPTRGSITGVVRDATRRVAISGVMVTLDGSNRGTLSDSLGVFELEDVPAGEQELTIRQYGYETVGALVNVIAGEAVVLDVPLPPRPEVLDGITVVADRLATMERRLTNRRNASAVATRAYDQQKLFRSSAWDVTEFLQVEAFLHTLPCNSNAGFSTVCVWRRGRAVEPRVYIDEAPVIGGLDQLATYHPNDLYLLEIYSSGQEIRAYTHLFMERMARHPVMLIPVGLPW